MGFSLPFLSGMESYNNGTLCTAIMWLYESFGLLWQLRYFSGEIIQLTVKAIRPTTGGQSQKHGKLIKYT